MKKSLTATDILNSVEFELLQTTLTRGELGAGIRSVRSYQNKARSKIFDPATGKGPSPADIGDLQLRLNEMMLTLIQVLGGQIDAVEHQLHQAAYLKQQLSDLQDILPTSGASANAAWEAEEGWIAAEADLPTPFLPAAMPSRQALSDLQESLEPEALDLTMEVRASHVPLVGGLLTRLRRALHDLVLFYVRRLARQQARVNQIQGEQLLYLTHVVDIQAQEIRQFQADLRKLSEQPGTTASPTASEPASPRGDR